jgi:hypothetical protein
MAKDAFERSVNIVGEADADDLRGIERGAIMLPFLEDDLFRAGDTVGLMVTLIGCCPAGVPVFGEAD